jgi:hypothetical protein
MPTASDWVSLDRQRRKLRDEEEEAMAKILRLRKQQRFLDDREQEMIRRGLSSLDELDEAEDKEKKEKEEAERREQQAAPSSSDVSGDLLGDPAGYSGAAFGVDLPLSPSFWDNLEFVGGTASEGQGS